MSFEMPRIFFILFIYLLACDWSCELVCSRHVWCR